MSVAEILREVADAHPDDVSPRLKLAAWYADHGEPERAEFVRLQAEEMRFGSRTPPEIGARAAELLAAHEAAWRMIGCPECGGTCMAPAGRPRYVAGPADPANLGGGTCMGCHGLGDAGGLVVVTSGVPYWNLQVGWRGGTPHAVVCCLYDAVYGDGSPTAWALRIVTNFGTIREVWLQNREPLLENDLYWWRTGDRDSCTADPYRVPDPLLVSTDAVGRHEKRRHKRSDAGRVAALGFDSPDAARAALAVGCGGVVRAAVIAAKGRG